MEEPAEQDPGRTKPKICVRYRMAYVGTVCVTNRDGETLHAWRYAATAHEGPTSVLRRMMEDVNHVLSQRPRLKLGIVQDGAPELWNLMRDALGANEMTRKRKWRETIDRYHFTERIAAALEIIYPTEEVVRRGILTRWREQLDTDDAAVEAIRDELDERAYATGRKNVVLDVSAKISSYVVNLDFFHYASLEGNGLHSGSGVTEGACIPDNEPREALGPALARERNLRRVSAAVAARERAPRRLLAALRATLPSGLSVRSMSFICVCCMLRRAPRSRQTPLTRIVAESSWRALGEGAATSSPRCSGERAAPPVAWRPREPAGRHVRARL
jgi:hypothetical protein